ncbi:aminotransferase class I/II-fold pyridoxal phosphate-dependent enzyme [Rhodopseudomonas sp. HC1]|uniref:pyridoxal phosphate-dependent aminotransferase n=1 Tax=Rhodopseudomonas infernalis TaxID=2897386 RepID=UPI001EE83B2D|nr:histidinol-phosphate transaminase [Rhodopseudomonas infernalis]MCG6203453.1 aminotransferase class I/II-fold pyridoxal phosphate-dependent enzyme [Rhodopseudomonas infernalis]
MTIASTTKPLRLSLNENPIGPSPRALQAINDALPGVSRYAGDAIAALKATIAAEDNVAPEQIVLGEVLNVFGLYLAAHGGPGSDFLYSEPGYTALVDAVAPAGGNVVGVPLDDRLGNDLPAFLQRLNAQTRAVYLVNPHNPTGLVEDRQRFLDVVSELSQRTLVLVDEAYLDFLPDFRERTAARLLSRGARVVVFRTFAKLHGLAGLGFGYALAPPDLAAAMAQIGIGAYFNLNRLGLVAASASLQDHSFIEATRTRIAVEREAWHALFRQHNRRFTESRANFVFFDAGRPQRMIASELAAKGIDIGRGHPPLENWVRISIGTAAENEIARQAVAELLHRP